MGCSGSKSVDNGSSAYRPQQQQQQQQYAVNIPPSTLPQGWISQYDPNKQSLYYVHPQTNNVTWAHPLGPSYHAQETTRFHQIQQLQRQQFSSNQSGFYDSYNRQGGMGAGAGLAMGMMAGGAMGLMAGSMLGGGMHGGYYGGASDVTPAEHVSGGDYSGSGDYSGGGDFGGGDFGGGDFGGGF
ncbi:hypothetical protein EC957_006588 [Mortierella hygrophila]|uniref:WW domain-containing protein n=1 Tax=Mortierella hygrophila TaxID=979708 RepID=A0A9P6FIH7_9FUNG|nr:hypothetical protein EC957_006588 [Mortierella hygrophila]